MTEELAEGPLPLYATEGGALALDRASPEGEDYLDLWCSLTINLSGGPFASTWRIHACARHHGHGRRQVGRRGASPC
ncbi:hypothetical protein [Collinsella sp. BG-O-102]|uniref:hypothetical protein n=1 Tax=Collinsella sp. BG-O-102 TaxID=2949659 RepID=UPI0020300777|nr:hypothetical protein [Collinsella sp. BG-O-102]MCM0709554.1 hypothetical protein [Collinsella sp. BG-O-102]